MKRSLERRFWLLVSAVAVALAFALPAAAGPDGGTSASGVTSPALLALIGNDDLFSVMDLSAPLNPTGQTPTQHYGPYASGSPDSSTCPATDWADDTFDRHFTVRSNSDGTNTVVEQFKMGSFITNAGPSPGGCDTTYTKHGTTVDGGLTGSMHGYFIIENVGSQTSHSPYCNGATNTGCTTDTFLSAHFAPCGPGMCVINTFFFHYTAGNQGLVYHEWKNASTDRGGNSGDVASD